jgi:hypothetical protein
MMADYNGWTNYETWNVNLWLDNEPHTQNDMVRISNRPGESVYKRATLLKNYVHGLPEIDDVLQNASLASDLLGAALSEVDWEEIVTNNEEEDEEEA